MNRNQYDTDVTVWSPQGRLFQVEYAMEAVNQGSASVGLTSGDITVIAGLQRATNELSGYQKKIFRIDNHIGICISGLTADARTLSKYMRTESLNHKFVYGSPIPAGRLVCDVADRHQRCTQSYVRRPYGVGLLIAGYNEENGAHLYRTCPSGNYYEYKAYALGARSQSARTYCEKHFNEFAGQSKKQLIVHALKALSTCTETDKELDTLNTAIAVVGKGIPFTIITGDELAPYLEAVATGGVEETKEEADEGEDVAMADATATAGAGAGAPAGAAATGAGAGDATGAAPMDIDG